MKSSAAAFLAMFIGSTLPTFATAADRGETASDTDLTAPFHSNERTYFREHRLKAYERTRAQTRQGATCVTPQGVCWIPEPQASGDGCACENPRLGTIRGSVGG